MFINLVLYLMYARNINIKIDKTKNPIDQFFKEDISFLFIL